MMFSLGDVGVFHGGHGGDGRGVVKSRSTCSNSGTNISTWRRFGGCPGGDATMHVVLRHRKSGEVMQERDLCTVCSKNFTDLYVGEKGHRVSTKALPRRKSMSAFEYLFGRKPHPARVVV